MPTLANPDFCKKHGKLKPGDYLWNERSDRKSGGNWRCRLCMKKDNANRRIMGRKRYPICQTTKEKASLRKKKYREDLTDSLIRGEIKRICKMDKENITGEMIDIYRAIKKIKRIKRSSEQPS